MISNFPYHYCLILHTFIIHLIQTPVFTFSLISLASSAAHPKPAMNEFLSIIYPKSRRSNFKSLHSGKIRSFFNNSNFVLLSESGTRTRSHRVRPWQGSRMPFIDFRYSDSVSPALSNVILIRYLAIAARFISMSV